MKKTSAVYKITNLITGALVQVKMSLIGVIKDHQLGKVVPIIQCTRICRNTAWTSLRFKYSEQLYQNI